ncbi:MAG: NAD(P)(+) transhydrogenase (Re/Si-specific) subunit beta [Bacteroidales bacterium]|nr:NAD(P)(+) transhydrogenase (Re/Si-specific) subunit beta [Bacteroidales bacterium]
MNTIHEVIKTLRFTEGQSLLELIYLIASVLFVFGLKMLSKPDTARKGNLWAAFGMSLAIVGTILFHRVDGEPIRHIPLILLAFAIGATAGWIIARRVKMTAMPQLVSLFNGMGGACAALIALMEFPHIDAAGGVPYGQLITIMPGVMIGTVSFTGSMIAFGKLNGNIGDLRTKALRPVNILLLMIMLSLIVWVMVRPDVHADGHIGAWPVYLLLGLSAIYGVLFVMPIGGADMPVVISLLNSFTGLAAAFGGFLYHNQAMLTGGILVGSAGTILTVLMCNAMNRSLINVIAGAFGGGGAPQAKEAGTVKEISVNDAAVLLAYSKKVIVVPGYGLAVAQAQHLCNEMVKLLEEHGVEVQFAIHPVAGRMPGHMNVLLAEADVPYDKLKEMDEINPELPNTDVVVVIGANDVVNPAAEDDPSSPIYGMPIIRAHTARNIIVMKRGMGKGYADIENFLFYDPKTRMLFGNAKDSLQKLIEEIKNL